MGDFFEVTIDEDRIKIKIINIVIMIFLLEIYYSPNYLIKM
jgi:hypothetical protein